MRLAPAAHDAEGGGTTDGNLPIGLRQGRITEQLAGSSRRRDAILGVAADVSEFLPLDAYGRHRLKVAFVGTHGVGKTTLGIGIVKEVAEARGDGAPRTERLDS